MKLVLLVLFSISCAFSGIEYHYNEKDKFTGNLKFKTKPLIILKKIEPHPKTVHRDIGFSVKFEDSTKVLCIEYVMWKGAKMIMTLAARNFVTLLLDDGSSIDLPVMGQMPNYHDYIYEHEFYIDEISSEILKNKKITDIRFNAQINGYDMTIPEDKREEIRELMKLFPTIKKDKEEKKENVKQGSGPI